MKPAKGEQTLKFLREALAADASIEKGAPVYPAGDVHGWLERLVKGRRTKRLEPYNTTQGKL